MYIDIIVPTISRNITFFHFYEVRNVKSSSFASQMLMAKTAEC